MLGETLEHLRDDEAADAIIQGSPTIRSFPNSSAASV
jgi:hypothetical protein